MSTNVRTKYLVKTWFSNIAIGISIANPKFWEKTAPTEAWQPSVNTKTQNIIVTEHFAVANYEPKYFKPYWPCDF